jgi:hypothetical protein
MLFLKLFEKPEPVLYLARNKQGSSNGFHFVRFGVKPILFQLFHILFANTGATTF